MNDIKKGDIIYDANGYKYKVHNITNDGYYCNPYMIVPFAEDYEREIVGDNLIFLCGDVFKQAPVQFADESFRLVQERTNILYERIKELNNEIHEKERELCELSSKINSEKKAIEDDFCEFKKHYELISKIESGKIKYVVNRFGDILDITELSNDDDSYYASLKFKCYRGKINCYLHSNLYEPEDFFETYEEAKNNATERIQKLWQKELEEIKKDESRRHHIYCDSMRKIGMKIPDEIIDNNIKYWELLMLRSKKEIEDYENKIKKEKGE